MIDAAVTDGIGRERSIEVFIEAIAESRPHAEIGKSYGPSR